VDTILPRIFVNTPSATPMGNIMALLVRDIPSPPSPKTQRFINIFRHKTKFRHNITTSMKSFTIYSKFTVGSHLEGSEFIGT
jgi:hypothetical protein